MNIQAETITINGVDYIKKCSAPSPHEFGPCRIIVADRGWIFVGNCEDHEDGTVTISNARNIRNWGTTKGLGQLATGPTTSTKFDEYGVVRCAPLVQINVVSGW